MGSERTLLSLALNDEPSVRSALMLEASPRTECALDPRTQALVRLVALVALDAAPASYGWSVDAALAAGATVDEIVGTLIAVAPVVGMARVVAAAPALASAIGYDIDSALERSLDP
jgi:alkylhydroperoxidase/carboxymuconolactone decarboxylase family protein YurZ